MSVRTYVNVLKAVNMCVYKFICMYVNVYVHVCMCVKAVSECVYKHLCVYIAGIALADS